MTVPKIVTLAGDSPAEADDADAVILTNTNALEPLWYHRSYRCAIGGIPVFGGHLAASIPFDSHGFGTLSATHETELAIAAEHYRDKRVRSYRRLKLTVMVLLIVNALFAAIIAIALFAPGSPPNPLQERVRYYQSNEGPPAMRLSARLLPRYRKELLTIRHDAGFASLPRASQRFVSERLHEIEQYEDYRGRFEPPTIRPHDVRTPNEVDALSQAIRTHLNPPIEFANAWNETEAVALLRKWQTDIEIIYHQEAMLTIWYRDRIRQSTELNYATAVDANWRAAIDAIMRGNPPLPLNGPVPGSPHLKQIGGAPLQASTIHEQVRVERARNDWQHSQRRLAANRSWYDGMIITADWLNRFAATRTLR